MLFAWDTPCGYCSSRGCADCGFTGYLVTDERADALLSFLRRHMPANTAPLPGQSARIAESADHTHAGYAGVVEALEMGKSPGEYVCRLRLASGADTHVPSSWLVIPATAPSVTR